MKTINKRWYENFTNYVCDKDKNIYDKACKWADRIEKDTIMIKGALKHLES
tara:strand:+ start:196 stop:348 length:153 start_codon:yes stop_codon:yes gene_type:complete